MFTIEWIFLKCNHLPPQASIKTWMLIGRVGYRFPILTDHSTGHSSSIGSKWHLPFEYYIYLDVTKCLISVKINELLCIWKGLPFINLSHSPIARKLCSLGYNTTTMLQCVDGDTLDLPCMS